MREYLIKVDHRLQNFPEKLYFIFFLCTTWLMNLSMRKKTVLKVICKLHISVKKVFFRFNIFVKWKIPCLSFSMLYPSAFINVSSFEVYLKWIKMKYSKCLVTIILCKCNTVKVRHIINLFHYHISHEITFNKIEV